MTIEVRVEGLACGRGRQSILTGVDLSVPAGSRLALVGPNGAGKSTLLRAIAGIDAPHAGRVVVGGSALGDLDNRTRATSVAFMSQHETPPGDLLVRELVALGRLPHGLAWNDVAEDPHVNGAMDRADVHELAHRAVDQLSGGELRRVLLARALAQETSVLLLDEPTNHLDLRHQHELLSTVLRTGATVIAAIHDLDLADRYFDHVAVLYQGQLHALGDPASVLTSEVLAEVFAVDAVRVLHPHTGQERLVFDPRP